MPSHHSVRRGLRRGALWSIVALTAFIGLTATSASGVVSTVYFWNTKNDQADRTSEAAIWAELGLCDADGKPGTIKPNDDIEVGGNVVGKVIKRAGNVVGLQNADNTKQAYDLMAATDLKTDGYDQVVNGGGNLDIRVHGLRRLIGNPPAQVRRAGGGLMIGTKFKAGFKQTGAAAGGTGVAAPTDGTIDFPAVVGGKAVLDLNVCYSSNDPDAAGAERAVTVSGKDINGIDKVYGHAAESITGTNTKYAGGTLADRTAAFKKAQTEAKEKGFEVTAQAEPTLNASLRNHKAVMRYIQSLNVAQRGAFQDRVASGAAKLQLTYTTPRGAEQARQASDSLIDPDFDPDDSPPFAAQYTPYEMMEPFTGGQVLYSAYDAGVDAPATVVVGSGDLSSNTLFHINQLAELPAPAPFGLPYLASGVFDFRGEEFSPSLLGELDYSFSLLSGTESEAELFKLAGSSWVPVSGALNTGERIGASVGEIGVFAAFSSVVPEPGTAALAFGAIAIALRRRRS